MTDSTPRVAAVVLNYNGREVTLQTLTSLQGLTYPRFDVTVVDNGSTDGSAAAVADRFPQVKQLRVEANQGIAYGLNVGVRWALARDYDYVLILNNDIEVDAGMLEELIRAAEGDPRIGCVGPKAYYYWDRRRIWSAGGKIRFREAVTRERGMGEIDRGQHDEPGEVDYVNGCACLLRASVLREVGLFDPLYVVSCEDADWCTRMKGRGYRCGYAPRAVLWHMVSQTTGGYRASRTYQTGRSTAIYVRRYASFFQWCSFWTFLALAFPVSFVRELLRGNQGAVVAKLRGVRDGLRVPLADPPSWESSPETA
ncbi:MAG: glycosyltransferase family 2 protein [Thermoanaerobaculia bacterium]